LLLRRAWTIKAAWREISTCGPCIIHSIAPTAASSRCCAARVRWQAPSSAILQISAMSNVSSSPPEPFHAQRRLLRGEPPMWHLRTLLCLPVWRMNSIVYFRSSHNKKRSANTINSSSAQWDLEPLWILCIFSLRTCLPLCERSSPPKVPNSIAKLLPNVLVVQDSEV
jgi:hypothetical protein